MGYTRKRKVGVFVIVPLLIIATGIGSAWFSASAVIHERLNGQAESMARHLDQVLMATRATLQPLLAVPPENCTPDLVRHLDIIASSNFYIGEIGLS